MSTRTRKRTLAALRRTAVHEAGHTLVAAFYRKPTRTVTIRPGDDYFGLHRAYPTPSLDRAGYDRGLRARFALETKIDVCLGGICAERMIFGRGSHRGAAADYRQAITLAGAVFGSTEETEAFVKWRLVAVSNMLCIPWMKKGIAAISEALLKQETLKAREVKAILADAMTPPKPHKPT